MCFDEIDDYPTEGVSKEGDQITLGTKRSETFWNNKIILGSTPTIKGESRIETSWGESDQRRYFVPCPHCGTTQVLKWANLRWDKDKEGTHLPNTAHFVCEASGCIIEERYKPAMIDNGVWVPPKPFPGRSSGRDVFSHHFLFIFVLGESVPD